MLPQRPVVYRSEIRVLLLYIFEKDATSVWLVEFGFVVSSVCFKKEKKYGVQVHQLQGSELHSTFA